MGFSLSVVKLVILSSILLQVCEAFQQTRYIAANGRCKNTLHMRNADNSQLSNVNSEFNGNKFAKKFLKFGLSTICSLALTSGGEFISDAIAAEPIYTVLGSNGKTGKMIVKYLSEQGVTVRPTSYSGSSKNVFEGLKGVEGSSYADVTKIETLEPALRGSSGVIFAASASNKGGKADKVDYEGVVSTAKECVRLKIPRLVVISSGAVTRPDSLGYKITNLFGNIMEYKVKGETGLKAAYADADPSLSYVIIRPGGLLDSVAVGPGKIELNQGDAISGEVNREDVAQAAGAAVISKTMPSRVTIEMYESGRGGPLEGKLPKVSGYERDGAVLGGGYEKLFEGLKSGEIVVTAVKK